MCVQVLHRQPTSLPFVCPRPIAFRVHVSGAGQSAPTYLRFRIPNSRLRRYAQLPSASLDGHYVHANFKPRPISLSPILHCCTYYWAVSTTPPGTRPVTVPLHSALTWHLARLCRETWKFSGSLLPTTLKFLHLKPSLGLPGATLKIWRHLFPYKKTTKQTDIHAQKEICYIRWNFGLRWK